MLPSLPVMGIATADPALFRHLMAEAGLKITPRNTDPLNTNVQNEAVAAVAAMITENTQERYHLDPYRKQLKTLAERRGYIVVIEHFPEEEMGDPEEEMNAAEPPFGGNAEAEAPFGGMDAEPMMPIADVGEGEAMMADADTEVQEIANLPIGLELADQIVAIMHDKEGPDAGPDAEMEVMIDDEPEMIDDEPGVESDAPEEME